jgi:hypothetical protein
MLPSAPLRSWLVSAREDARFALSKACATSASPAVNAVPLATKPTKGISASVTMRVRTETRDIMRWIESDMRNSMRAMRLQAVGGGATGARKG